MGQREGLAPVFVRGEVWGADEQYRHEAFPVLSLDVSGMLPGNQGCDDEIRKLFELPLFCLNSSFGGMNG